MAVGWRWKHTTGDTKMSDPSPDRHPTNNRISRIRKRTRESQQSPSPSEPSTENEERVNQVQKEWQHRNLYMPDELDEELETVRDELADAIAEEMGGSMAVTRHFYPVVLKLGLRQIDALPPSEFAKAVDTIPGVGSEELER